MPAIAYSSEEIASKFSAKKAIALSVACPERLTVGSRKIPGNRGTGDADPYRLRGMAWPP